MKEMGFSGFRVVDLRTERLRDPLGLDAVRPRFSWRIETELGNFEQRAYRIAVGTTPDASDLWDSGVVESSASNEAPYEGGAVPSYTRVYWTVTVTGSEGGSAVSETATWESGPGGEWPAKWIETGLIGGPRSVPHVPLLRRCFESKGEVVRARLYATAMGIYRIGLNGHEIGEDELAPGWTDYRKRVRYQAWDVTGKLTEGQNCIFATLGDGWYCGHLAWRDRQFYGDRPKLLALLRIEYADGSVLEVPTDDSWRFEEGEIQSADFLMGEIHDLRLQKKGWKRGDYDDSGWRRTSLATVSTKIESQIAPPIRVTQTVIPISVRSISAWPSSRAIFDLGQNIVGRVSLNLSGPEGQTVTVRYAERLKDDGALYTDNYRSAKSVDVVTLGSEPATFEPAFTFHGFQYVEIVGLEAAPDPSTVSGVVMHSDWQPTGSFSCSDPKVNQLFSNIRWGWKGNSLDVPTDCPQRDERLGWTGDAQVFVRTAAFLGDVQHFFEKYVQDLEDSQFETGSIPCVAPDVLIDHDGGPAWADAFVICPWVIYRYFGDLEILRRHFPAMKKWHLSLDLSSQDWIRSYEEYTKFKGFGDWLSTNAETPIDLIGTAFAAYTAGLLESIANVLGHAEDAALFAARKSSYKEAFQNRFVTPAGLVASGSQTSYVLALYFDLLPSEVRPHALEMLVRDIERRGWKLSTGFVGTPYLLHVLTEGGRVDVAYKLLLQEEWPSWLYPVTQGATTIWERWDGWTKDKGFQDPGMNSFNHYAYGAVGDWLVSEVAGLKLDGNTPAYQTSELSPRPGGGLTQARADLATRFGVLSSGWEIENGHFLWHVSIPPNSRANLKFPPEVSGSKLDSEACAAELTLGSGHYTLTGAWSEPV